MRAQARKAAVELYSSSTFQDPRHLWPGLLCAGQTKCSVELAQCRQSADCLTCTGPLAMITTIEGPYYTIMYTIRIGWIRSDGKVDTFDFLRNRHYNYTYPQVEYVRCRARSHRSDLGSPQRITSHISISSLISHEHLKGLTPSACDGLVISVDAELLSGAMAAELR